MPPKDSATGRVSTASRTTSRAESRANAKHTWEEIRKHNTPQDCWIVMHDLVYDVSKFLPSHPGGPILDKFAGTDATDVFKAFHREAMYKQAATYCIGTVSDPIEPAQVVKDFRELQKDLMKEGLFDCSWAYYMFKFVTNFLWLVASVWVLASWPGQTWAVALSAFLLGCFYQQKGWEGHDFLHNALFKNNRWNEYTSYFLEELFVGFSGAWWKKKHNAHHAASNVHGIDEDIDTTPLLAWSEYILDNDVNLPEANWLVKLFLSNQTIGFPLLLSFARYSWLIQSIQYVFFQPKAFCRHRNIEKLVLLGHHFWTFYLALFMTETWAQAILFYWLSSATFGVLLAIVFSLNHNAMPIFQREYYLDPKNNYYELQIRTTRNIHPGWFNDLFTGGLNYQIEHHMFPFLPRHNYHLVAPRVIAICKKNNIPYYCTDISTGMVELFDRLKEVSEAARKGSKPKAH